MIYIDDIVERIASALDAEGSERYTFEQDYKPAINFAQEWLVSLFNSAFSANKLSEESLKELMRVSVFRTSSLSRLALDEQLLDCKVWSIVSLFVDIEYVLKGNLPTQTVLTESQFIPNASYRTANYQCKRTTLELSVKNKNNPFEQGNSVVQCEGLIEYAFILFADYTGGYLNTKKAIVYPTSIAETLDKEFIIDDGTDTLTVTTNAESIADIIEDWIVLIEASSLDVSYQDMGDSLLIYGNTADIQFTITDLENAEYYSINEAKYELEILPAVLNELVAVAYLKYPERITGTEAGKQFITFPDSLINLVTEKALQFISYKQGDSTNLYGVSRADVKELITLMS